jgi:hypothetical protein
MTENLEPKNNSRINGTYSRRARPVYSPGLNFGFRFLQACAAATALLLAPIAHAQSVVTLYENDFDSPDKEMEEWGECLHGTAFYPGGGSFADDYSTASHPIIQAWTVDRLCVSFQDVSKDYYYDFDPLNPAGRYTGGMHNHIKPIPNFPNQIEAWGMQFDPQGKNYLNLSLDWSLLDNRSTVPGTVQFDQPADVVTRFYRVPAGAALDLIKALPPEATIDGLTATPFAQSSFTIQPRNPSDPNRRFEFNWQKQALSVGLSGQGFQAGDKVAVVYHVDSDPDTVVPVRRYVAFDNYVVTASNSPLMPNVIGKSAVVPANALWALVLMVLGILGFGWRGQRKRLRC